MRRARLIQLIAAAALAAIVARPQNASAACEDLKKKEQLACLVKEVNAIRMEVAEAKKAAAAAPPSITSLCSPSFMEDMEKGQIARFRFDDGIVSHSFGGFFPIRDWYLTFPDSLDGGVDTVPGEAGSAAHFDGESSLQVLGISPDYGFNFDGSSEFTIALWVYDESSGEDSAILGKRNGCSTTDPTTIDYQFLVDYDEPGGDSGIKFGSKNCEVRASGYVPTPGEWHHLVVKFDGTSLSMYADGAALDVDSTKCGTVSFPTSAALLRLGATGTCDRGLRGSIDDVRVWSRALNSTEIECLAD